MGNELTKEAKLNYCRNTLGYCCRSHFYNGHNPHGVEECWNLAEAELDSRVMPLAIDSIETEQVTTLKCFSPQWDLNESWVSDAGLSPKPLLTVNLADAAFPQVRVTEIPDKAAACITLKGTKVSLADGVKNNATVQIEISTYQAAGLIIQLQRELGLDD